MDEVEELRRFGDRDLATLDGAHPARTTTVVERVTRYWDWRSASYARGQSARGDRDEWLEAYRRSLDELFPGREEPLTVLDVGTGPGFVATLLAELGHGVTGVDVSGEMLALAREDSERRSLSIRFVRMRAEDLSALGRFDVVTCRCLLWTLPDPIGTLAAWRDAIRPGGAVLVADGVFNTWLQELRRLSGSLLPNAAPTCGRRFFRDYLRLRRHLPYYRGLTARDACELMIAAGFVEPRALAASVLADIPGSGSDVFMAGARRVEPGPSHG